jgi:hypothetical protein
VMFLRSRAASVDVKDEAAIPLATTNDLSVTVDKVAGDQGRD